jgi:protein involved in ribonucleotide reduction
VLLDFAIDCLGAVDAFYEVRAQTKGYPRRARIPMRLIGYTYLEGIGEGTVPHQVSSLAPPKSDLHGILSAGNKTHSHVAFEVRKGVRS